MKGHEIKTVSRDVAVRSVRAGRIDVAEFRGVTEGLLSSLVKVTEQGKRKILPPKAEDTSPKAEDTSPKAEGTSPKAKDIPPHLRVFLSRREVQKLEAGLRQYSQHTFSKAPAATPVSSKVPPTITTQDFTREYGEISKRAMLVSDSLGRILDEQPENETLKSLRSDIQTFFKESSSLAGKQGALKDLAEQIRAYSFESRVLDRSATDIPALHLLLATNTAVNAGQGVMAAGKNPDQTSIPNKSAVKMMLEASITIEMLPMLQSLDKKQEEQLLGSLTQLRDSMEQWLTTYKFSRNPTPDVQRLGKQIFRSLKLLHSVLRSDKLVRGGFGSTKPKFGQGVLSKKHKPAVTGELEKLGTFLKEEGQNLEDTLRRSEPSLQEPPPKPARPERLVHSSSKEIEKTTAPVQKSEVRVQLQQPEAAPRKKGGTPQAAPRRNRGEQLPEGDLQRGPMLGPQKTWQGLQADLVQDRNSADSAPGLGQAEKPPAD